MTARRLGVLCTAAAAILALAAGGLDAGRGAGRGDRGRRGGRGGLEMRGRQGGRGGGQPGRGRGPGPGAMARRYERNSEMAIGGVVVDGPSQGRGAGEASGMMIRAENGELRRVRLGPPWYVDALGLAPAVGDRVDVIGAPSQVEGEGEIIAREVRWRGQTFQFRARRGGPMWSGAEHRGWQRYSGLWTRERSQRVSGEIERIGQFWPGGPGMGAGIGVQIRTRDRETTRVHLGPSWFVEEQLPDLRPGQQISVTGSPVKWGMQEVLLAEKVEREGMAVGIRDEQGRPMWSGGWQDWGGWGPGSRYGRSYDPSALEKIAGEVEKVDQGPPDTSVGPGGLIAVRTQDGRLVRAHLAPLWFMEQVDLSPKPGDDVTLEGSMVGAGENRAMMVRSIKMADSETQLRGDDGVPVWAGARRGGPGRGGPPTQ